MVCCGSENEEHRGDRRCSLFPYKNMWLIGSQLFQITAFVLSYSFMGVFFIGFIAMLMQQLLWCCRQTKSEFMLSSMLSVLAAGLAIWSGISAIKNWSDPEWCEPIFFYFFWKPGQTKCGDRDSAALAFVGATLWLASAVFTMIFVFSERQKRAVGTFVDTDHYDCEAGADDAFMLDYQTKRTESQKSAFAITKSEQFAPPIGSHEYRTTGNRKSTIGASKSEQFAPPMSAHEYHSEPSSSRKSTIDVSKSEQFAPPMSIQECHSERSASRKSTINVSKSEQFAPPDRGDITPL